MPTRKEQARRDAAATRDSRWSVQGPATFTTRSRVDDTRDNAGPPPQWVLDRIADEEFWQGTQDRATCPTCWLKVNLRGECGSCGDVPLRAVSVHSVHWSKSR